MGEFCVKRWLGITLLIILPCYAVVAVYARLISERSIFQPQLSSYRDTQQVIKLASGDGTLISAIYLANPAAQYTILYSHGNAEDIGQLGPILDGIHHAGFAVLAYDYRGYGTSAGRPTESGAYQDADAAYAYLTKNLQIAPNRIIALGRSLGGAVSVDLASRRVLAGLVVESSFVSAYRVMTTWPLLPFDRFDSAAKIGKISIPVFILHGTHDTIIPFWHGEALYRAANQPKRSLWIAGADHNDLFDVAGDRYGAALKDFAASINRKTLN